MAVLLILVSWIAFGCAGGQEDNASQESSSSSSEQTDKISQPAKENESEKGAKQEPEKEPSVINLSGNGQTATDPFELEAGLSIFRMSYEGERNFIVQLLDGGNAPGGRVYLANEIGSFEGSEAMQAKAGQHILDVQASGPWTITIEQPRPTGASQTGNFAYNTGKTATDFFQLERGLKKFSMTHQGERNFIVWLLDKNGARVNGGLQANEIGPFEGSKAIQVPKDDIYLLQVEADGLWSVEAEGLSLSAR